MDSVKITMPEQKENSSRIIVSLTTYPARIDRVHKTIDTLIRQTLRADKIVLWLAEEQFPGGEESLPEQLLAQKEDGLRIEWCSDIKSYKKIIPSAEKWPEDIIITADDDIIYELNTIERLMESYKKHPECVSTLRTHLMLFAEDGMPIPYDEWKPEYSGFIDQPLMALFPTTGAGTLFPPGVLPEEAFDREKFMSLCPKADDVWIKCMLTLAGVPVVLADTNTKLQYVDGTQQETLYSYNRTGNDEQLKAVIAEYNNIGGEELPDDTLLIRMNDLSDYTPDDGLCQKYRKGRSYINEKLGVKVSVILTGHNTERRFIRCLRSAQAQSLSELEIICIDNGSTDGTAELLKSEAEKDSRIRVIILDEKVSPTAARRTGVMESKGEYVLVPDINGMLAPDACEQLYSKAEEDDADILAFSCGEIAPSSGNAEPVFSGYKGCLRNKNILLYEFAGREMKTDMLSGCIFGGRLARKAYLHADEEPCAGSIYDYFLLCRGAEVYYGAETQIYYAAPPAAALEPKAARDNADAIKAFIIYAHLGDQFEELEKQTRRKLLAGSIDHWVSVSCEERKACLDELISAWEKRDLAAGLTMAADRYGDRILRQLKENIDTHPKRDIESVGIIIGENSSARELFIMTELIDCIASEYRTVLIGVSRETAANAVMSAKCEYVGAELSECGDDALVYAYNLDKVLCEAKPDAVVAWAGSAKFLHAAVQATIYGIPVVAALTEPVYGAMTSCARPSAGLSALRLASVTVTDLHGQYRLLDAMGVNVRCIPRPAIRPMGGRSNGRAAADVIVWAGETDETRSRMSDSLEIFRKVHSRIPSARMLMYFDGSHDSEQLQKEMPEGVSVRKLRADYGIFSDAAVQLVTGTTGTVSETLRAGRTLGIPTVMYRTEGERDSGAGAIAVQPRDCAAAADALVNLITNKELRDHLGAQAKIATGACSREEAARRWCEVLNEVSEQTGRSTSVPADEMGCALSEAMTSYEDGALYNADRLEEYRLRCQRYEEMLEEAEQLRIKEGEAHEKALESARAQFREERRAHTNTTLRLEEMAASTSYKAGSVLTFIPRKIKKLIASLLEKSE